MKFFISCVIVTFISNPITCKINNALYPDHKNIWSKGAPKLGGCPANMNCDPRIDCDGADQALKVPDPEDCNKFYYCINQEPTYTSYSCPSGQKFDRNICDCVVDDDNSIKCCTVKGLECNANKCEKSSCQNSPFCFEGISTNCSQYYYYSQNMDLPECPKIYNCPPEKPFFNIDETAEDPSAENYCTDDSTKCCIDCTSYCSVQYELIADPCNCNKYYLCMAVGDPDSDYHLDCQDNKCFDSYTRTCIECGNVNNVCGRCESLETCKGTTRPTSTTTKRNTGKKDQDF